MSDDVQGRRGQRPGQRRSPSNSIPRDPVPVFGDPDNIQLELVVVPSTSGRGPARWPSSALFRPTPAKCTPQTAHKRERKNPAMVLTGASRELRLRALDEGSSRTDRRFSCRRRSIPDSINAGARSDPAPIPICRSRAASFCAGGRIGDGGAVRAIGAPTRLAEMARRPVSAHDGGDRSPNKLPRWLSRGRRQSRGRADRGHWSLSCRGACHGVAQARHASLGDNYGGRIITMALRLQSDGPRNVAGQVVKGGEGTPSVLAVSNDSSADAKPIGAPKPGPRSRRDSAPSGVR